MINKYLPLLAVLSLSFPAAAQPIPAARAHYAAVNKSLPQYHRVKMDLMDESSEGGELVAYLKKGQPQKLVATYYGEGGRAIEEYYFWQGRLFFELRTDEDYEFRVGDPKCPGRITKTQERFYFRSGNLVKWIGAGNKPNGLHSTAALQAERDITDQARKLLGMVRAAKK